MLGFKRMTNTSSKRTLRVVVVGHAYVSQRLREMGMDVFDVVDAETWKDCAGWLSSEEVDVVIMHHTPWANARGEDLGRKVQDRLGTIYVVNPKEIDLLFRQGGIVESETGQVDLKMLKIAVAVAAQETQARKRAPAPLTLEQIKPRTPAPAAEPVGTPRRPMGMMAMAAIMTTLWALSLFL